jgi:hypothetical protein
MARFSRSLHLLSVLEGGQPVRRGSAHLRLSWRGRTAATAFMLPGVAAATFSFYLPNSDQGGVFSIAALTFYAGASAVFIAPACALMYAHWTPALLKVPDHPEWNDGPRRPEFAIVSGWILVGVNVLAGVWFVLLSSHALVELVTAGLFAVAALTHAGLTIARAG